MKLVFGRQPAWWLAFLAVIVELGAAAGLPLSEGEQAAINAAATAVMGFLVALSVAREQALPLVTGLVAAAAQLAISFGAHLDAHTIALVGTAVTMALAWYWHMNVTAPVDADGQTVPKAKIIQGRVE